MRDLIQRTKEEKWAELCEEVDREPSGKGYKIVMRKLGWRPPKMAAEDVERVVEVLFPRQAEEENRPELP